MNDYETQTLIDELEKLVVSKTIAIKVKDHENAELKKEVASLKSEIERLENLLTPKFENQN